MCPQSPEHPDPPQTASAHEILTSILDEVGDLSKLLEIFYLAQQPGALDLLHWAASLSDEMRMQLIEFISAMEMGKRTIELRRTPEGGLLLQVPD